MLPAFARRDGGAVRRRAGGAGQQRAPCLELPARAPGRPAAPAALRAPDRHGAAPDVAPPALAAASGRAAAALGRRRPAARAAPQRCFSARPPRVADAAARVVYGG